MERDCLLEEDVIPRLKQETSDLHRREMGSLAGEWVHISMLIEKEKREAVGAVYDAANSCCSVEIED